MQGYYVKPFLHVWLTQWSMMMRQVLFDAILFINVSIFVEIFYCTMVALSSYMQKL